MKNIIYIFTVLIFTVAAIPAVAEEKDHVNCDELMIKAGKMGMVDEESLKKHIDSMDKSLSQIKRKSARREEHRQGLQLHQIEMQKAMKEMHNMKLMGGCQSAAHGASMETRMMMLEKRVDMMHTMMQQMLDHQQESERE